MNMLRKGVYEMFGRKIEVVRDLPVGTAIMSHDILVDDQVIGVAGQPLPAIIVKALSAWRKTMPAYNELITKIAEHLVMHHHVPIDLSNQAASYLVRDCGLSSILLKGISESTLGETPRRTTET